MEAQKIDRMKKKATNTTIHVRGSEITVIRREDEDYISLTDMVRNFEGGSALIEQWLKNKDTVLFLGVWEQLNNPDFNSPEFEGIKNEAGRNSFYLSAKKWMDTTGARGLIAKAGRYGGKALYAPAHRSKIQNHQSAFINPRPPPTAHRPQITRSPTIAWSEALCATISLPAGLLLRFPVPENEHFFLADMLKDRFRISAGNFDFHARLQRVLQ
jgi:hypothetical protein